MKWFPSYITTRVEDTFLFTYSPVTIAFLACCSAVIIALLSANGSLFALVDTQFLVANSFFGQGSSTPVFNGSGLEGGAQIVKDNIQGVGIIEEGNIIQTIIFIIKYVLIFAGLLALFAFIWAGFLYITTFLQEENTETAKKVMMYAAIGILIIIFSWVIVDFLTTFDID